MLELAVFNSNEHFQKTIITHSFSVGSQQLDESENYIQIKDSLVSPLQFKVDIVESESGRKIRVANLGRSLVLNNGHRMHHGLARVLELPCMLGAGETQIQINDSRTADPNDNSIQQLAVFGSADSLKYVHQNRAELSPSPETLTSWFDALGQIQRSTAGQSEFFKMAARCIFNPGGLDGCIILRRFQDNWQIASQYIPYAEYGISYRKDLVDRAIEKKSILFHRSSNTKQDTSQHKFHAAIVCPVLDANLEVVAVVYGFRTRNHSNNRNAIRGLEAKFVSLVADSISAGLFRLEQEADSARKRVLLQQAFSAEVAEQLEANPDFLNGQNREVSVLFADIRNFCQISENIGASLTYQLLTDVMDRFTEIIHDYGGVVIDYYGDGISAFWNAPVDQPDHALLACKAAISIEQAMLDLNEKWSHEIGSRLRIGIGVNTGNAQVGNSGSRNRLKYGPQGTTVNVASRLEQATKKLGVSVVVSGETARRINGEFIPQRICSATFSGINAVSDLVQLVDANKYSQMTEYFLGYQDALEKFESGKFEEAVEILSKLESLFESEHTTEFLLKEAVSCLGLPADNKANTETDETIQGLTSQLADSESQQQTIEL